MFSHHYKNTKNYLFSAWWFRISCPVWNCKPCLLLLSEIVQARWLFRTTKQKRLHPHQFHITSSSPMVCFYDDYFSWERERATSSSPSFEQCDFFPTITSFRTWSQERLYRAKREILKLTLAFSSRELPDGYHIRPGNSIVNHQR